MEENTSSTPDRAKRINRCLGLANSLPFGIVPTAIVTLILRLIGSRAFIWTGSIALALTVVCLGSYGLIAYDTRTSNNK